MKGQEMTRIVRTTADILYPFSMVFGCYIVAHGHLTPGGGFQGGAVMATATALLIVAHRYDRIAQRIRKPRMKLFEAAGLMGILLTGATALFIGRPFLQNWLANSGHPLFGDAVAYGANPGDLNTAGLVPIMNIAVGIEVLGALTLILLYMLSGLQEENTK